MNGNKHSRAGFCLAGILAAIVFTIMWFKAMDVNTAWEYGVNSLSDMGVSSDELAANLFNYGCMVTGILGIIFALGKVAFEKNENRASGFLLFAACVFLFGIGIFTSDFGNGNLHYLIALLFFLFLYAAIIVAMIGNAKEGNVLTAAFTGGLVVIAIAMVFLSEFETYEVVAVACGLLWLVAESIKLGTSKA